ncbi:MAG: GDSL family lipase [Lachnospiraceae bacterium]|nr:GDSL family lipase [Lachnospiraceae bacterium]
MPDKNENLKYYGIKEVPELIIHGRTLLKNDVLPLFWNNSGIEVCCDGTELWITVESDYDIYEPWYAVEINGALITRSMLYPGENRICLFRNMSKGVIKRVFFYRELQPMGDDRCSMLVKGIFSDGEFFPVPKYDHRIEFIGDSISSGEGTYGAGDDMDWIPMYMSSSRNYINMIAKKLNADVRIISQGGWGVYCSFDADRKHSIPVIYDKICGPARGEYNKSLGAAEKYDPSDWQADAVVINLGTNDATGVAADPSLSMDECERAVKEFLKKLRGYYKKAHLLWVYGMLGYDINTNLSRAVNDYINETGDKNVSYLTLPNTLSDELGSRMHPGLKSHAKAAAMIADYLSGRL